MAIQLLIKRPSVYRRPFFISIYSFTSVNISISTSSPTSTPPVNYFNIFSLYYTLYKVKHKWYHLSMTKDIHTTCPIAKTAKLMSDTWTMLIIRDLLKGEMRFSELENSLSGISSRTLTLKLKKLEQAGIVGKSQLHYKLTSSGKKLNKVIVAMESWGKSM